MRFELLGSMSHPEPVTLTYNATTNFDPTEYALKGYVYFDVICIGAGGGTGGGIDTENTGTQLRSFGGAGGGGGIHRVKGLLASLPPSCSVVIGNGGGPGMDDIVDPTLTTDGEDGGYTTFNETTCMASGGVGGKRALTNSATLSTGANGGDGGTGGRTIAGGGGVGGTAGTPEDPGPGVAGTDGADGTWDGFIGSGGGGGAGGVGKYGSGGSTLNGATQGGRGAYNAGDLVAYAPGGLATRDNESASVLVVPGGAGGAKASPLNGLPYVYGSSKGVRLPGDSGIVVIRITAE